MSLPRGDRLRPVMARHVAGGSMPGLVGLVRRRGDVRAEAIADG